MSEHPNISAINRMTAAVFQHDRDTLAQVFDPDRPAAVPPGGEEGDDEEPAEPVNQPTFEWDGTERINVLLLGTDARYTALDASVL